MLSPPGLVLPPIPCFMGCLSHVSPGERLMKLALKKAKDAGGDVQVLEMLRGFTAAIYNCYSGTNLYNGNDRLYRFTTPAGATRVTFNLTGLSDNLDLFLYEWECFVD